MHAGCAYRGVLQTAQAAGNTGLQRAETVQADVSEPEGMIVKSPLVGTFYAAPSEDADPFVSVGDQVKKGQTLAIVEAMKLMNEIESDFDGKVAEIYVENGQAVEYGQPFRIVKYGKGNCCRASVKCMERSIDHE